MAGLLPPDETDNVRIFWRKRIRDIQRRRDVFATAVCAVTAPIVGIASYNAIELYRDLIIHSFPIFMVGAVLGALVLLFYYWMWMRLSVRDPW